MTLEYIKENLKYKVTKEHVVQSLYAAYGNGFVAKFKDGDEFWFWSDVERWKEGPNDGCCGHSGNTGFAIVRADIVTDYVIYSFG